MALTPLLALMLALLLILSTTLTFCLISLSPDFSPRPGPGSRKPGTPTRLVVVLGSGGHTAEMLAMLRGLDVRKWTHRTYVVGSGDAFSARRAREFEAALLVAALGEGEDEGKERKDDATRPPARTSLSGSYDVVTVPRAREIHQSILTTPLSSLRCLASCIAVLRRRRSDTPDATGTTTPGTATPVPAPFFFPTLILSNGPATGVIVILASLLLRLLPLPLAGVPKGSMRTVYVESFARVRALSLSGKLLLGTVDRFVVQWEGLVQVTGGKAEWLGVLV